MEKISDVWDELIKVERVYSNAFEKKHTKDDDYFNTVEKEYDDFIKEENRQLDIVEKVQSKDDLSAKASRFVAAMEEKYKERDNLIWTVFLMILILNILTAVGLLFPIFPRQNINTDVITLLYVGYSIFAITISTSARRKAMKKWPAEKVVITKEDKKIYKDHFKHRTANLIKSSYFEAKHEQESLRKQLIQELASHNKDITDYNNLVKQYNNLLNKYRDLKDSLPIKIKDKIESAAVKELR